MFGCESCQDIRIYFGGQFCRRGHLHPLTNSTSRWCPMLEAVDAATPELNLNINILHENHLLEAASLPGKKSQLWTYLDKSPWKALRLAFSGCRFMSKQMGHQHQPRRLEKTENARISRVLWSTRCREVAENNFPPRNKRSSRETTEKWTSCDLAPGVCMFVTRKSF